MTNTTSSSLGQIQVLLARKQYAVTELNSSVLSIREMESGITLRAVLEDNILFLSLVCAVLPASAITQEMMRKMLAADNGISTSHFQLYDTGKGELAITLNNFCKLQDMGPEDEDDILSCVSFLLADVVGAKDLIGSDLQTV
ncbi:MAG: hypothetical protein JO185_24880 [Acidobacteriaceae bacterium]|nr:hypothetical protein [Acidobacteriaceae bacterium]